jgi:hypothetical protein
MLLYSLLKLIVIDFNEVILKYIKIYYSSFFIHIYILKRNYTVKKNLLYIFDTYIFGTDYTILWSVNPLSFLFI